MFIENSAKHLETKIKFPMTVPECIYVFIGTHKYSFKKKEFTRIILLVWYSVNMSGH